MIRDKLFQSRLKKCVGLAAVFAVLLMACPVPVAAAVTVVSIPDAGVDPSDTVTLPINITDVTSLGAATIWLTYDSSVVEVTAVADGDLPGVNYTPLPAANAAGELRMTWFLWPFVPPGPSGDLDFASVTLQAVGSLGQTSALDLDVKTLTDTDMMDITYTVVDGLFTVGAPDTTPPTVTAKSPTGYNVPVDTVVTATFSEAMAAATITTDSFTLTGSTVSGTVSYDPGTLTATFTPDADLDYSHKYTAALSTDITDLADNPLSRTYSWSFTTVKAPHLELAKSVSPSTIGQEGSGISPEETTVTLTVSGAGEPGKVAGEDIVVTDVLRSYINLEDEFTIEPDTETENADGTTTLVWELEGSLSTTDEWTVSFDISSDKCGRVLVNVVDESKVTYTDYEEEAAEAFFPETDLHVRCPREEVAGAAVLPGPASFSASYLNISPQQVLPSQQVEISINISNTGEERGSHTVALYINGFAEQSQTIGVSPGSSKTVVFKVTKTTPGTYQVNVEGMPGQFTVLAPAAEAAVGFGGPLGTGGIIAIVVVAIALVCGLVFGLRRE